MSSQDEFLQIDTPENVVFGYEVAGIGSRFLAALVDHAVIIVIQLLIYLIVFLAALSNVTNPSQISSLSGWIIGGLALISFVVLWGYYILFEALWNGQTPGKRLMKLRVIRVDGTPITLVEALIRNLVRLIDFIPVTYGIGIVVMFVNSQSRRLGDLAAGTLVVFDRSEITLESLGAHPPVVRPAQPLAVEPATEFPVERLTERDASMIEDYLRRRRELAGRARLAQQLAETIHRRLDIPYQSMGTDALEAWLAKVLTAYRQRSQ